MAYKVVNSDYGEYVSVRITSRLALTYKLGCETRGMHPIFIFKYLKQAIAFATPPMGWNPHRRFSILRCKTVNLREAPSIIPSDLSILIIRDFWAIGKVGLSSSSWPIPSGTMIADAITPTKVVRTYA